jgi:chromatin modification-related protein EAF6
MAAPASAQGMLEALAQRKARLEEELREVEKQVYNLETSYLNDSSTHGNVLKGFEGFLGPAKTQKCVRGSLGGRVLTRRASVQALHGALTRGAARRTNRARNFKTEDRLFSLSSTTSPAVRQPFPATAALAFCC